MSGRRASFVGPGGARYELALARDVGWTHALEGAEAASLVRHCLADSDGPDVEALAQLLETTLDGILDRALVERIAEELEAGPAGRLVVRPIHVYRPTVEPRASVNVSNLADLARPESSQPTPATTTWFEVQLVDEIGDPIADVPLSMLVDGARRSLTTDGSGKVRVDDAELGSAVVYIVDPPALREAVTPRWEQIREEAWVTEDEPDHTFFGLSSIPDGIRILSKTPHVLVVQPRVVLARILGMLFDTSKSFLLPLALPHLQRIKRLYDQNPGAAVLIVGHTDTTGDPDYNDPLSLERAKAVQAFLADDPAPWLDWYDDSHPTAKCWGSYEDGKMLAAVLERNAEVPEGSPLRHFQTTRGLEVDGVAGPQTREALIKEYMGLDDTTLPEDSQVTVHGCGENFPLDEAGESVDDDAPDEFEDAVDRRVELFFFEGDLGVLPPPPGDNSTGDSEHYPEWRKRARETHEFVAGGEIIKLVLDDPLFGPSAGVSVEITYEDSDPETIVTDGSGAFVIKASRGRFADLRYDWQGQQFERRVFTAPPDGASKEGAWQRLVHLGYVTIVQPDLAPADDDVLGDALLLFQIDYGIEPTGELDPATADALIAAHDEDQRAWKDRDWGTPDEPDPDSPRPKEMVS